MPALPIVLTGMPLSGKTTVGGLLARELAWPFVDLDETIEARTGRRIADWFAEGEAAFRRVEHRMLAEELGRTGQRVIAAGGGALELTRSLERCLRRAYLVYLEATVSQLMDRIHGPSGRPLIDGTSDPEAWLAHLLERRVDHYQKAHLRLTTADRSPPELARMIADAYSKYHQR